MSKVTDKQKEKERQTQLKALREELHQEITDQLPAELAADPGRSSKASSETHPVQDEEEAKRVIEAILFTASKPVTTAELKRSLAGFGASRIEQMVRELQSEYVRDVRSFRIQEIAGGFECSTDPRFAPWILKLELQRKAKQATQSALETLAILAYKQPITRAEIEDLRGVDVSGVLSTLVERGLIKIVGKKEVPGRPFLYGTTEKFLEHFGLKSIQNLPDISEIRSLIENSVKKEDLLRTEKIISTEENVNAEPTDSQNPESEPVNQDEPGTTS
jgi:segregation and condensation protein B